MHAAKTTFPIVISRKEICHEEALNHALLTTRTRQKFLCGDALRNDIVMLRKRPVVKVVVKVATRDSRGAVPLGQT